MSEPAFAGKSFEQRHVYCLATNKNFLVSFNSLESFESKRISNSYSLH